MVIYSITNSVNGKKYIGRALNFKKRKAEHIADYKNTDSCKKLYPAMRVHGIESFVFTIEKECNNEEDMWSSETEFIKKLDTIKNGYNCNEGGKGGGVGETNGMYGKGYLNKGKKRSPEVIAAMSGENSPMFGKKLSEEQKNSQSSAMKKRWEDPVYREKHTGKNNHMYGKTPSELTKQKLRDKMIGRECTWGRNISKAVLGKEKSEETRKKMSETKKLMKFKRDAKGRIMGAIKGSHKDE